jgi:thioredoxin 2
MVAQTADTALIDCPSCGAKNRVPRTKLEQGAKAVCGRCKAPLPMQSTAFTVTDAIFASVVETSPLPVLVDAWAAWCGPCRAMAPIVDELAAELSGRVRVGKLNVDENPLTAQRFALRSIPTLLIFNAGREVDRIVGAQPKDQILQRLTRALAHAAR